MGQGGVCIIDNPHPERPHWGPDINGIYREWGLGEEIQKKEVNNDSTTSGEEGSIVRWVDDDEWVRNDPNRRGGR